MRFYRIDTIGKMWVQRLSAGPVWSSDDEGRIWYSESVAKLWLGGPASWETIWTSVNQGSGSGLDADLLDGQQGSYYRNASNLNSGTVPAARLSGTYNINISGNAATATAAKYA